MKQALNVKFFFLLTLLSGCSCKDAGFNINTGSNSLIERIKAPAGYSRTVYASGTSKHFLQNLPLSNSGAKVLDYKGNQISNQSSHIAVVSYDVGSKDLQQCADAVIRLRANIYINRE